MEKEPKKLNINEEAIEEVVETVVKETEEAGMMDAGNGCTNFICAAE